MFAAHPPAARKCSRQRAATEYARGRARAPFCSRRRSTGTRRCSTSRRCGRAVISSARARARARVCAVVRRMPHAHCLSPTARHALCMPHARSSRSGSIWSPRHLRLAPHPPGERAHAPRATAGPGGDRLRLGHGAKGQQEEVRGRVLRPCVGACSAGRPTRQLRVLLYSRRGGRPRPRPSLLQQAASVQHDRAKARHARAVDSRPWHRAR
jgi:hypothetical protein